MATFLSDDWFTAAQQAVTADPAFTSASAGKSLGVQFVVSDGADGGPLHYYLSIVNGDTSLAKGELEGADVTVSSDTATAAGIAKGELNTQMAFMTGKIKVTGNLATLMMHQNIISAWAGLSAGMDTTYE